MEEKQTAQSPKKPAKKPRGNIAEKPEKLRKLALDSIIEMVKDESLKSSERLSAAKALLDYLEKQPAADGENELMVVFENLPEGFAD